MPSMMENQNERMVRYAPSKKVKRDDLTLESMAFLFTLGSDTRKKSLWKRWDYRQVEDKTEG